MTPRGYIGVRSACLWAAALGVHICCALFPLTLSAATSTSDNVSGTWGPVLGNDTPVCRGLAVLVFDGGRYYRVLPDVGSTGGTNQLILTHSTYRVQGNKVSVAPTLSVPDPQPRQTFTVQRIGGRALILEGRRTVVFRPCPAIDPARLDATIKRAAPDQEQNALPHRDRKRTPSPADRE